MDQNLTIDGYKISIKIGQFILVALSEVFSQN